MRRSGIGLYIVLLGLAVSACAHAGILQAPGEDLEVSLVTYGPGAVYWERFGHDAIRIRDRVSGESGDFNYGVFDFEDSAFIWNFARGHMRYMIDVGSSDINQQDYIDDGRSVLEQRLALSAAQAVNLRAFLLWNLRPENLSYDYDYLTSNCSTRIRDALNSVLGGALRPAFISHAAPMTYRQQIDRMMSVQPWLMLGMDLGLGPSADKPLNEWQESFLPVVLAREIRTVRVPDGHGGVKPLVASEREIAPNHQQLPGRLPPDFNLPLGIAGLTLAVLMLVTRVRFPALYGSVVAGFLVLAGVLGTLLLALWALTLHYAAWKNENLLVFNPLAFVLVRAAWRSRNGRAGDDFMRVLAAMQVCAAVIGLVLHFLLPATQQNLPWLLFAIPVWLAVAGGLWQGRLPTIRRRNGRHPSADSAGTLVHALAHQGGGKGG